MGDFFKKKDQFYQTFPLLGRFSFFLRKHRPELRQYYWESDDDEFHTLEIKGVWFIREQKISSGVRPFGSLEKFYENDFVWLNHSISPTHIKDSEFKTKVGIGKNSYDMSVLNFWNFFLEQFPTQQ